MSKARANADATSQAYIENIATDQNLSGTYSTERLYFNDSYKLTGDVNVTGHLALGSVADSDVVITQDSTERTITGSGTIESGELLSSKETDLTGMTGELGSVVTGSPNLNLGNATGTIPSGVSFPQTVNNGVPIFIGHEISRSTVHADGSTQYVTPNTGIVDSHSWWSEGQGYKPQQAGYYFCTSRCRFSRTSDSISYMIISLRRSGTEMAAMQWQWDDSTIGNSELPGPSELIHLNGSSQYIAVSFMLAGTTFKLSDTTMPASSSINIFLVKAT